MRIGFVSARSIFVDESGAWIESATGRLVDRLAARFGGLVVAMSLSPTRHALHEHRLTLDVASIVPLPWMPSVSRSFHRVWATHRAIRQVERRCDAVVLQLPFAVPLALFRAKTPRVYHVCADVLASVQSSPWYRGLRGIVARALAHGVRAVERHLVSRPATRVVTNGAPLLGALRVKDGTALVSSAVLEREILSVSRTRGNDGRFRILYVGYLRPEKGIDLLIDAFARLRSRVRGIELRLVTAEDAAAVRMAPQLKQQLDAWVHAGLAVVLKHAGFGEGLFQQYADADVLVLPSRTEGTPRVLVEARAFGCPVVATSVGGIPTSVESEIDGLLVPPEDAVSLAAAIERVALDGALAGRLREGGLNRARATTLERFADSIAAQIDLLL